MPHCPTCDKTFLEKDSKAMPFCSERCRMIDLGRWLDETQRLPIDPGEEEEGGDWEKGRGGEGERE